MTSLRWDNVPKRRVERPPLPVPSSKSAHSERKPPNLKDRIEQVGGAQIEPKVLARSASAAPATSAKMGSQRCSACKARGVTLWLAAGRLVCASCRKANEIAYAPQSGHWQESGRRNAAGKEETVMAATYNEQTKPSPSKQKSCRNRGFTPGDATPRRKTVARYDCVAESELSPETAALLMELNQQDTLVDMWR
jgi:hypothetical protein